MTLIDRDALLEELNWLYDACSYSSKSNVADMIDRVESQPDVDAVPVVHGEWIPVKGGFRKCSRCGIAFSILANAVCNRDFCPNCGAKMDGGEVG